MGAFFTNCNVRTTDIAKCARVLQLACGHGGLEEWVGHRYDE